MEEKELTNEEVIKALECCSTKTYCEDRCEYRLSKHGYECIPKLMKQALDLIQRLQAEIERLKDENCHDYHCMCLAQQEKAELQKQVDELKENK